MLESNVMGQNQKDLNHAISLSKQLSDRIDEFLILCVYEQEHKLKDDSEEKTHKIKDPVTNLPIFIKAADSNSFIIWKRVYRESTQVFNSLRHAARNRLIRQIAENIVIYLLKKYKKVSQTFSIILNDEQRKNLSIQYIEDKLKRDTFLVNDKVWEDFCEWFRMHLTEWVLEEMVQSYGFNQLESLDKRELNELFYQYISKKLSNDHTFLTKFASIVNNYTIDWMEKISLSLNLESCAIHEIEHLLNINPDPPFNNVSLVIPKNDLTSTLTVQDYLLVMNNASYQSVRESLYKKDFNTDAASLWPSVPISKGTIEGTIQVKPIRKGQSLLNEDSSMVKAAWKQAERLSDLDADIFDALCTIFLSKAKHYKDIVEILLDDLLAIRGLQSKLGGEGRRGGYEFKQRRQVLKSLSNIQNLWINLNKAVIYKKGKPVETKVQSRAFLFLDQHKKHVSITEDMDDRCIRYTVGEVFASYLFGSGRQVALLPLKVLHYDPYRKTWEKRLARYLSWRWRIQARKKDFLRPNKISTLLEAIGVKVNDRTPSRTRDRLETALDILQADGLIESWHYEKWNESIANQKGWSRIWMNSMIVIAPPDFLKEQYHSIKRKQQPQSMKKVSPDNYQMEESNETIGIQIRRVREKFTLSLYEAAGELEISSSYLSNIERGLKIPSAKIQSRLINWLERFN